MRYGNSEVHRRICALPIGRSHAFAMLFQHFLWRHNISRTCNFGEFRYPFFMKFGTRGWYLFIALCYIECFGTATPSVAMATIVITGVDMNFISFSFCNFYPKSDYSCEIWLWMSTLTWYKRIRHWWNVWCLGQDSSLPCKSSIIFMEIFWNL